MAEVQPHHPVLLILAAFSRYGEALDWAWRTAESAWGPIALESERFEHRETAYYESTMGSGLVKTFFAFQRPFDPAGLADCKRTTNEWEVEYARHSQHPEPRPLNLDPGYLTEAKLVLATTKDRDHRVYLSGGIYAEVTLHFQRGAWQARPWTYPDYQRADYHAFFLRCREYLRQREALTSKKRPMSAIMDDIGARAAAAGLTPEKLESLLDDERTNESV